MNESCALNESGRLEEPPFLLPLLCCPLLMGLQNNQSLKRRKKNRAKMYSLLAAALPLLVFVVAIIGSEYK